MYTAPELFQAAFSYRDFVRETAFLREIAHTKLARSDLSWIDWACGSCEHLRQLHLGGAQCFGIDISSESIAFAHKLQPDIQLRCGDASQSIRLGAHFDVAVCLNDSISHFVSDSQVQGLFANVAQHLVAEGLFVIETQHSLDGHFADKTSSNWTSELNGKPVQISWKDTRGEQGLTSTIAIEYQDQDGELRTHVESFGQRRFTQADLVNLAAAVGLQLVDSYGGFDHQLAISHAKAWRGIYVFQKRPHRSLRED